MQWWAVVVIIGTLLGLFNDTVAIFSTSKKDDKSEGLISIVKVKKTNIDTTYSVLKKDLEGIYFNDKTDSVLKEKVKLKLSNLKKAKNYIDTLYSVEISAFSKNNLPLAYETHSLIHNSIKVYGVDELLKDTIFKANDTLKAIFFHTLNFIGAVQAGFSIQDTTICKSDTLKWHINYDSNKSTTYTWYFADSMSYVDSSKN